eukprot:11154274-Lingulodinium_polyedra.AAC.1
MPRGLLQSCCKGETHGRPGQADGEVLVQPPGGEAGLCIGFGGPMGQCLPCLADAPGGRVCGHWPNEGDRGWQQ